MMNTLRHHNEGARIIRYFEKITCMNPNLVRPTVDLSASPPAYDKKKKEEKKSLHPTTLDVIVLLVLVYADCRCDAFFFALLTINICMIEDEP